MHGYLSPAGLMHFVSLFGLVGPQAFNDPKGISIRSMDFDNPKVYGDASIFDDLVIVNDVPGDTISLRNIVLWNPPLLVVLQS